MPNVNWTVTGDRAVLEATKKLAGAQREHGATIKETAAEHRRYDRLATEIVKRNTSDAQKYAKAQQDIIQVLNTQRGVTKEMADKELRRLKEQWRGTGEEAKRAGAEQAAALTRAKQLLRSLETDQQRYNRAALEVQKLRREGLLTDDQAIAAVRKLRAEMIGLSEAEQKAAKERDAMSAKAVAILKSQETAQQRYNMSLAEAIRLRDAGLISTQQLATHEEKLRQELLGGASAARDETKAQRERTAALAASTAATQRNAAAQQQARKRMVADGFARQARDQAEMNRLRAEAASVLRSVSTAQDDYNQKLLTYQRLRKAGVITDQQAVMLVRRSQEELKRAGEAGRQAFGGGALAQLRNYALGVGGIMTAVGAARNAYMEFTASVDKRAQSQVTAAEARRSLRGKIAPFTEDRDFITSEADRISAQQGIDQRIVDQTFEVGISASSDPRKAIPFIEYALAIERKESAAELAGSIQDTASALGVDSPAEAYSFINLFAVRSRIEDRGKAARNLPRVLQSGKAFGMDPYESAALYGALTNTTVDPFGEVTRTSAINLTAGLGKFFSKDRMKQYGIRPEDADTAPEQLALILADPEGLGAEAPNVIKGFRGASIGGVRGFTQNFSESGKEVYNNLLRELKDKDALRLVGEGTLNYLDADPGNTALQFNQRTGAISQRSDIASGNPALTTQERDNLDQLVRNFRRSAGTSPILKQSFDRWLSVGAEVTPAEAAGYVRGVLSEAESALDLSNQGLGPAPQRRSDFGQQQGLMQEYLQQMVDLQAQQLEAANRAAAAAEGQARQGSPTSRQE